MTSRGEPRAHDARRDRLTEIDGLRALSFVLIVVGHSVAVMAALEHGPFDMAVGGVVLALTRFALPAFMVISSALIASAVRRGTHAWRLSRLVIPYVAWSVIYVALALIVSGGQAVTVLDFARRCVVAILTGTGYYHLWYVVLAVQIAIVAPFVARILMRIEGPTRWFVVVGAALANMVLLGQMWGPITDWSPTSLLVFGAGADRNILFWSAYVVLGSAIGLDREGFIRFLHKTRVPLALLYLAGAVAMSYLVWTQAIHVAGDYGATSDISRVMQPWIVPFEVLSILFWFSMCALVTRGRIAVVARSIAELSYGGYLIHPMVILLVTQVVLQHVTAPAAGPTVAVLSVTGVAGSLAVTRALGRIAVPLGSALTGIRSTDG